MKGLLLKDFYMLCKHFRYFLLFIIVFLFASLFTNDSFFLFYSSVFSGMIPYSLLSLDQSSKWNEYSETLPYTKAQLVSAKYLIGLIIESAVLFLSSIIAGVGMHLSGSFRWSDLFSLMSTLLAMGYIAPAILLPFVFKLGVEKGRLAYMVMIGFACAASTIVSHLSVTDPKVTCHSSAILPLFCLGAIGIYALSWYLSIVFYRKREI